MLALRYNLRSLVSRRGTSAATIIGIGVVVFMFVGVQMFTAGLEQALGRSGEPDVALVLADGASSEAGSHFEQRRLPLVLERDDVARAEDGRPAARADIVSSVRLKRVGGVDSVEVLLRGMVDDAYGFRRDFEIVSGRAPRPGADEAIVGTAIAGRFEGSNVGDHIELGRGVSLEVVGTFVLREAVSLSSEVWTHAAPIQRSLNLPSQVSCLRVRLQSAETYETFAAAVEEDLDFEVVRETDYYDKQSRGLGTLIRFVATIIVVLFSLGAVVGATITMHTSVAHRRREIAMLLALGFSRGSVLVNFLLEACALSMIGGAVGLCGAAGLTLTEFTLFNFQTNAVVILPFIMDPSAVWQAMVFSVVMGFVGGLFPAVGASRMSLIQAMRI